MLCRQGLDQMNDESSAPWGSGLAAGSFEQVRDDLVQWLKRYKTPHYSSMLFIDEAELGKAFSALPKGWPFKKPAISKDLFLSVQEFTPVFQALMEAGYDWLKLSVEGIVDDELLIVVRHAEGPCGCAPEDCFVNYTLKAVSTKWKPSWTWAQSSARGA
jgi:hypothetical protein